MTNLLKNELDFQGYVISGTSCGFRFNTTITLTMIHKDWAAQHTTVGSANAGLVGIRASNIGGESVLT
jgi:hypothetical protein